MRHMHFLFGCYRCFFLGLISTIPLSYTSPPHLWLENPSIQWEIFRIQKWWSYVNVPYHILGHMNCGDIPYIRPYIWDWYLQFRFLKWPLIHFVDGFSMKHRHLEGISPRATFDSRRVVFFFFVIAPFWRSCWIENSQWRSQFWVIPWVEKKTQGKVVRGSQLIGLDFFQSWCS